MTQHCKANPCCGDVPCSGVPVPQDESGLTAHNKADEGAGLILAGNPYVAPMTSGEAFGKAVDVIDSATEEFAKFARQGAAAYFAKLEEGKELFEAMSASHLKQIGAYMESAAETMSLNMQKAFADAAE